MPFIKHAKNARVFSYAEAMQLISESKNGIRKLDGDTFLHQSRWSNSDPAVMYHETNIVTIHKNNTYTLNSGGWAHSTSTRNMLSGWSPAMVVSEKGKVYVSKYTVIKFEDDPIRKLIRHLYEDRTVPFRWMVEYVTFENAWNKSRDVAAMLSLAREYGRKHSSQKMLKAIKFGANITPDQVRSAIKPPSFDEIQADPRMVHDPLHIVYVAPFRDGIVVDANGMPVDR